MTRKYIMFVSFAKQTVQNAAPLLSLKKNLVYNFLLSLSQVLLPLVSIPYVSRVLTPDGIGRVSFIDSFTYYFIAIAEFGIVVYGMREIARVQDDKPARDKLVSELLSLHVLSSSISLILYSIAVFFAWKNIQDIRLLLFSLSFLLVNFFACEWYFLGLEQFRYITLRSLCIRLLGLASLFILVKQPADYYIYYAIIALSSIITSLWNNYLLFKEVKVSFRNIQWKKHIAFTKVTYLISLTYGVNLLLDNVFLRFASTATAVGYYAFSMKIIRTSGALLSDSLLVFFPRIVALIRQQDTAQLKAVVKRNLQLIIFFAVPLCVGTCLVADSLVVVFLGDQFLPVVPNLWILAAFPLLRTYNLFLSKQILIAHNREALYLRSLVWGSLLFMALCISFSYFWADRGASFAIMIAEVAVLILNYTYARRTAPELPLVDAAGFGQSLGSALLFIPVVYFLKQWNTSPLAILVSSITACIILYITMQLFVMRNAFALSAWQAVRKKGWQGMFEQ
jgi:O-antigen/teichoic acid export membrane protein